MIGVDAIACETRVRKLDLIIQIYGDAFSWLQILRQRNENIFLIGVQDFRSSIVVRVAEAFQLP